MSILGADGGLGFAFFSILRSVVTLEEAMNIENARENMRDTVEQVIRLLLNSLNKK